MAVRTLSGAATLLAVMLAAVAPAGAATLTRSATTGDYTFTADAGEADVVNITNGATGRFVLSDTADTITLGAGTTGCTGGGTTPVNCAVGPSVTLNLDDGDDTNTTTDNVPMQYIVNGGSGADSLDGGSLDDTLNGGPDDDTLLSGDAGDDTISGSSGEDLLLPGPGTDAISGGSGTDTVSYSDGRSTAVIVNIGAETGGDGETFTGIEAAIGGAGDDTLSAGTAIFGVTLAGGSGEDTLNGGSGNDMLIGGTAADRLNGGTGNDTASYRERSSVVATSLSTATGEPRQDGDIYSAIDNLEGGNGADTLRGDGNANVLVGNNAADTLVGGLGADTLHGGGVGTTDGFNDTASYDDGRPPAPAVVTTLGGGARQDNDRYEDIQNLTGGDGNDTLTGNAAANLLVGGNGADVLIGAGGADTLNGGLPAGPDTSLDIASYAERAVAVAATLGGAVPDGDVLLDIGGLEGGAGNDTLTGDGAANVLRGGGGDDTLTGGAGSDDLQAGAGNDVIHAQDGAPDDVGCGADNDTADGDLSDTFAECETKIVAGDADGDGSPADVDCNDGNAAVRPGAAEVPGNGVDENCDGRDDPLPFVATPVPTRPTPVTPPRFLNVGLTFGFTAFTDGTLLTLLDATRLPAGTTVRVTCKATKARGRAARGIKRTCPYARRDFTITKAQAKLRLAGPFAKRHLPPGSTLRVVATAPNAIGKQLALKMRTRKRPTFTSTCVSSARKTVTCP